MTKDEAKPLLPQYHDENERGRGYVRASDYLSQNLRTPTNHAGDVNDAYQNHSHHSNGHYSGNFIPLNDGSHQPPHPNPGAYPPQSGYTVPHTQLYTSLQRFGDKVPPHQNMLFRNDHGDENNGELRHYARSNNPRDPRDRSRGPHEYPRDRSRGPYDYPRDRSRGPYDYPRDRSKGPYDYPREHSRGPPAAYYGHNDSPGRRYSQSDLKLDKNPRPLFQRLLSSHYTVSNPYSTEFGIGSTSNLLLPQHTGDNASLLSFDIEEQQRRLSVLNTLRPQKLIGNFKPVCQWQDYLNKDFIKKKKSVKRYYEDQNSLIEKFTEIDNFLDAGKIHYTMLRNYDEQSPGLSTHEEEDAEEEYNEESPSPPKETTSKFARFYIAPGNIDNDGAKLLGFDEEKESNDVVFAILVNFFINILLLVGKIAVAMLTDSISVIASLVDSILDFLSTFIIYIANRLSTEKNWKVLHAYPVGRSRLEPLGVLVFSIIIIISFFQVGQESFKRLFFPTEKSIATIGYDAIAIMSITIVAKIGCWIWCSSSKNSSVQALAQDAMTDIVFNTVSLLMPTIGHFMKIWWLDPLGALALSIYVIISWAHTAYEHIDKLTGAVADPIDYKVILYLAYRFAEPIKLITALKVYHVGDNLSVEIDIVFAIHEFDLSFKDCHDIAEALQYAIETLPMVERAFVHIDYMEGNFKGHLK